MNAVIYARYSSDSQREESIEGQLRECREYAERNGMTVVGTYIDRALSAKTADRPKFQHMIKDSAKELLGGRRKDTKTIRLPATLHLSGLSFKRTAASLCVCDGKIKLRPI